MMLAQRLYEGVELGKEGPVGLITYMRTDSTRVSDEALAEARGFIGEKFGAAVPARIAERLSQQEGRAGRARGHPADVASCARPESVEKYLAEDELKLYRLIWMRFRRLADEPAVFDQTTIDVEAHGHGRREYLFRATGSVPKFDGFLAGLRRGQGPEGRRRRGTEAQAARGRARARR